jgi:hypothetical protein
MGVLRGPQPEHRRQVRQKNFPIWVLLDCIQHLLVHLFLISFPLIAHFVRFLLRLEDISFLLLGALLPLPAEVLVVDVLRQLHAAHVNLSLSADHVPLTDAPQRTRIDAHGAGHEQQP